MLLLIINGLAFVVAIAWLISEPGWKTVIAALTLLATLTGLLIAEIKETHIAPGKGSTAISTEENAEIHLDNQGVIRAGAGGIGGGGDAIHVASGVKMTAMTIKADRSIAQIYQILLWKIADLCKLVTV